MAQSMAGTQKLIKQGKPIGLTTTKYAPPSGSRVNLRKQPVKKTIPLKTKLKQTLKRKPIMTNYSK